MNKKIKNVYFIIFLVLVFSCKTKERIENVGETQDLFEEKAEVVLSEKTESRPRIRELDWYVGKWKACKGSEDYREEESASRSVELEIKIINDKYCVKLNENGKKLEGELYIDKYFLPENIPDEEKVNYDSRDYIVADFGTIRYWIGIRYGTGNDKDVISVNLDDIAVYVCEREAEKPIDYVDIERGFYRIDSPEGLRVRESASLDGKVLYTYPDNFIVCVTEIDDTFVEIDGIKSCWVKVYHNTDSPGWLFGGYLKQVEKFPENHLGVNEYCYTQYKTSYGKLTPSVIDDNWESFYIFFKDYIGEPQQFELDVYDMYTNITYDEYKIFTGLYKDKQGNEGYFIVKMDLSEKTVLDKLVQKSTSHSIVFLKPWNATSEFISVGRRFESEAGYYISKNNISEILQWSDDY